VRSAVGVFVKQDHKRPNSCGICSRSDCRCTQPATDVSFAHSIIRSC
jgi:hypothetical protein